MADPPTLRRLVHPPATRSPGAPAGRSTAGIPVLQLGSGPRPRHDFQSEPLPFAPVHRTVNNLWVFFLWYKITEMSAQTIRILAVPYLHI